MKLSVIILNYNVRYFLELCLKSVQAATVNIEAEIIVVDNHSSDDSCEMVKSLFPQVVLIENDVNYGFSKGNNQGVSMAKGEYICILNPDMVVSEDTFDALLNLAETSDNFGILGCRLVDGSGTFLQESKRNIPLPKIALKKLLGFPKTYYANQVGEFETGRVEILVGAFMLMKKVIFNKVNGFDEDYFMYGEDVDLSYRIHKMGYKNWYYGAVTNIHFKGESTLRDKNYTKRFYSAMQVFYKKHFKGNIVFDAVVWIGIWAAYLIRTQPKTIKNEVEQYVLVSKNKPNELESVLLKPIQVSSEIVEVRENTEVILDANMLTYKEVIAYISDPKINNKAKFKILPKNSDFLIGSHSSKSRGEVIKLKGN
ncbi:glycosyltransferase family 2 protein [Flavobacteriaceae bacterium LMO-SS05]